MNPNAMLSKQHTEAIKSASTEADKVKRAAAAMIETVRGAGYRITTQGMAAPVVSAAA